jgi:serpin B
VIADSRDSLELRVANSLWAQDGLAYRRPFLEILESAYGSPLQRVDFARAPDAARVRINRWAEALTRGRIARLLPPGAIDQAVRLVLVNAIYFRGGWAHSFPPSATREDVFFLAAGDSVRVPLMNQQGEFPYAEDAAVQLLELPYRNSRQALLVVLPRERDGLEAMEARLSADVLRQWMDALESRLVRIWLPRWRARTTLELSPVLAAMGMPDAFGGKADFSGMSEKAGMGNDLFLSRVDHQAWIQVDEKGTEAAAATAVAVATLEAVRVDREPPKPILFRADHPFCFALVDRRTGVVLFLGRVTDPSR